MNDGRYNILLVLTGGTICSFADSKGERASETKKAQALIVENFRKSDSLYRSESCVDFTPCFLLDILSENMTLTHLNTLISGLKKQDFSLYDGVIILHGTDTLAYTASLLSLLLAGINIPVFLISSQLPIYEKEANGNDNFKAAVELTVNGIAPNVYAVYKNSDGKMFLHYGCHLLQCANHSNDFYSSDMTEIDERSLMIKGEEANAKTMLLDKIDSISSRVLKIEPYVGIDYSSFNLNGVKAVLHGVYHSSTLSVNPYKDDESHPDSVMYLKKMCDSVTPKIPIFIQPCDENAYSYETTGIALRGGIIPINGMTGETAYTKLLLGLSLGYEGSELVSFMNTDINGEFIL